MKKYFISLVSLICVFCFVQASTVHKYPLDDIIRVLSWCWADCTARQLVCNQAIGIKYMRMFLNALRVWRFTTALSLINANKPVLPVYTFFPKEKELPSPIPKNFINFKRYGSWIIWFEKIYWWEWYYVLNYIVIKDNNLIIYKSLWKLFMWTDSNRRNQLFIDVNGNIFVYQNINESCTTNCDELVKRLLQDPKFAPDIQKRIKLFKNNIKNF